MSGNELFQLIAIEYILVSEIIWRSKVSYIENNLYPFYRLNKKTTRVEGEGWRSGKCRDKFVFGAFRKRKVMYNVPNIDDGIHP